MKRLYMLVLVFCVIICGSDIAWGDFGDEIADQALSHPGGSLGGSCKEFVKTVLGEVGISLGAGYRSAYLVVGREIISSEATKGDIIQISNDADALNFYNGMHTAIVLENLGGGWFEVVDSNWCIADCEIVSQHTWNPFDRAREKSTPTVTLTAHFYRVSTGLTINGVDTVLTPRFLAAYQSSGGYDNLGTPADNGGGEYVHEWYGVWLQDFDDGSYGDGTSALAYDPTQRQAFLIKEGFWGAYKYWKPTTVGYPTANESPPGGTVTQTFSKGIMTWQSSQRCQVKFQPTSGGVQTLDVCSKFNIAGGQSGEASEENPGDNPPDDSEARHCTYADQISSRDPYYSGLLFNGEQEICGIAGWQALIQGYDKGGAYIPGQAFVIQSQSRDANQYLTDVQLGTHPSYAFPVEQGVTYRFSGLLRSPEGSRRVIIALTRQSNYGLGNRRNEVDQTLAKPCDLTVTGEWQEYTCDFPVLGDEPEAALRFFSGTPVGELQLADLWLAALGDSTLAEISAMIGAWAPGRGNGTITNGFKAIYTPELGLPSPEYEDGIPFVHAWRGETIQFFPDAALMFNSSSQRAWAVEQPFWYAYQYSKISTPDNLGSPTGAPYPHACGSYTCQSQPFQYGRLQFDPRLPERVTQFIGSTTRVIMLPPELAGEFSGPRLIFTNTPTSKFVTVMWSVNPNNTMRGLAAPLSVTEMSGASLFVGGRQYDNESFSLSGTPLYFPAGKIFTLMGRQRNGATIPFIYDQWLVIGGRCTANGCVAD